VNIAPPTAASVALQGFENEAGRHAVGDPGLDDRRGPQMPNEAPDRPHQRGVAVIPGEIAFRAKPIALGDEEGADLRP